MTLIREEPRSIKSETGKLRRFASGLLKDKGYTVSEKAASGQYIQAFNSEFQGITLDWVSGRCFYG